MKYFLIILFFLSKPVFPQQKELTLKDAVLGELSYLVPETIDKLAWQDESHYTFVDNDTLWRVSVNDSIPQYLSSLFELQKALPKYLSEIPEYLWVNEDEIQLQVRNTYFIINIIENKVIASAESEDGAENTEYCRENNKVAYTKGDDLYIAGGKGSEIAVTSDGGGGIVNGKYVHRKEFGIKSGIFWSPKGNFLAFYRKDERMVADYPLVDYMAREARLNSVKYAMAGMASHHVRVGVYNLATQGTVFLESGQPLDHYLTNISWAPDEETIFVAELNRGQDQMKLNQYDAVTGKFIKTLFEEKNKKYVEPLYPIRFSKANPSEFYYLSRRDGWFHLYKYNTGGRLLEQITSGDWDVTNFLGFDEGEKNLFIEATKESPLERHVYKVKVGNGRIEKLTSGVGVHSAVFSPSFGYFIDEWSGANTPREIDLIGPSGKLVRNLLKANDPLKGYSIGQNEIVTLKAADGKTDLYGRLIKPANFDSTKKYPIIIYVYGGPHVQLVDRSWHNKVGWWQYYMASKGYLVFTLDNRGSANRGLEFENITHRNLGLEETADQMKGIEYLRDLPFVDEGRIGVFGWSYGGFMTLNLKLRHPEVFKVGVAGGPVVDWSLYEVMYGERYMDTPKENPVGYRNSNMLNYIGNLQGKLMLIHGAQDETVVMQHSMKFLRQCIKLRKQVDFFVYPTHPHNVMDVDRVHLMEKVSNYFFENL